LRTRIRDRACKLVEAAEVTLSVLQAAWAAGKQAAEAT
jgi:hypothetical protein